MAKNGADFLNRIQANEASNPKFSFLKDGDPYNAYFQMRVNEGPQPGTCLKYTITKGGFFGLLLSMAILVCMILFSNVLLPFFCY